MSCDHAEGGLHDVVEIDNTDYYYYELIVGGWGLLCLRAMQASAAPFMAYLTARAGPPSARHGAVKLHGQARQLRSRGGRRGAVRVRADLVEVIN